MDLVKLVRAGAYFGIMAAASRDVVLEFLVRVVEQFLVILLFSTGTCVSGMS